MSAKPEKILVFISEASIYALIFTLPFSKAAMQSFCWLAIAAWLIKKALPFLGHFLNRVSNNASVMRQLLASSSLNAYLLVFLILCAVSSMAGIDAAGSLEDLLKKIVKYVLLYLVMVDTFTTQRRFNRLAIAIVSIASLVCIDALVQHFRGIDFLRKFTGESGGLRACFETRNGLGGWVIMNIPFILAIIASKKPAFSKKLPVRLFLVLLLACIVFVLILTRSRSAWLGFAFSAAIFIAYFLLKAKIKIRIIGIAALIILLIGTAFVLPQNIKSRLASATRIENSTLFRINLWKESLQIIEDFPLFGVGFNTYSKVGPRYSKGEGGYYPHNSYLHMAAEIGIIGLCAFLLLIAKVISLGFTTLQKTGDLLTAGIACSLIALLAQSFFDVNLYALQLATLFWFIIGLLVSRINLIARDNTA